MFIEKDVINFSTSPKKKVKMAIKSFISGGNFGNSQEIFLTHETVVLTLMKAIFFQMILLRYFL